MNILSINKADRVGGAAEVAWDLKSALETRGHKVDMFVCDKTSTDKNVHIIPRPKWLFYLSHLLGTDINLFKTDYILETEEFKKADIIHCHNLHGHYFNLLTLLKMSRLKPVVWTLHDMWALTPYCSHSFSTVDGQGFYSCQKMSTKSVCKRWNKRFLQATKLKKYKQLQVDLVVPSQWLAKKVSQSILKDKNLHLIHNGIDLNNRPDVSKREELRKGLNLPTDKKIVLFVASGGKDNIWKGWKYAEQVIDNFKDREDILFVCIGGNKENNERKNLMYIDYVNDKQLLAKYYASANAFMLTSTAESFALVVIEAMFAGLPVVSFEVGVVAEVIKHRENGYIAKYLDSNDFTDGLRFVLDSNLEINNENLIKTDYSVEAMAENYLKLYQEIFDKTK